MRTRHNAAISIRLRFAGDARLGPGKIALLEAIARTGSIAAAGREMGMSYRRAWLLIDSLNRMFDEPVVLASPGGQHGGGAGLTPLGGALVGAYRAMEADAAETVARHFAPLRARMRDDPPDSDPPDAAAPDADPSAADQRTRGA